MTIPRDLLETRVVRKLRARNVFLSRKEERGWGARDSAVMMVSTEEAEVCLWL